MHIEEQLKCKAREVEELLAQKLPEVSVDRKFGKEAATVIDAMNYSVRAGGKRLRPVMLLAVFRLFGGTDEKLAESFAVAVEWIHTYSLVHDDLPAMDNDDYRRGKLTTHKAYGEAMGILAGDALLNGAYEVAAESLCRESSPAGLDRAVRAMYLLARYPGIDGMLGGQVVDIEMEQGKQQVTEDGLLRMYEKKTSALMRMALEIGCVLAGGTNEECQELKEIGRLLGLAFQVQDDILDTTGDEAKLGKPLRSDERNQKTTYAALVGLEEAKRCVKQWSQEAVVRMRKIEARQKENVPQEDAEFLSQLIEWLVYRDY